MVNLLRETLTALQELGKNAEDVVFIGNSRSQCSWNDFLILADIEYDDGYGGAEILNNLVIVFKDGTHLQRAEYDGSEWWEYRRPYKIPSGKLTDLKSLLEESKYD